ncbi:MAG: hypothetical protein ACLQU3_15490 [Limisphaerales bacterium]
MTILVHQLLHGYRRGHELLAASTPLQTADADALTRLSDLSGSLVTEAEFKPYLTAFPVPSEAFYAVARTWLDDGAPRAGCVVTHTLLISMADWEATHDLHVFSKLFASRPSTVQLSHYEKAIECEAPKSNGSLIARAPRQGLAIEFVSKFFGQGLKPLIWFEEPHAEDAFWLILAGLWPKLRRRFACCTFSLQPRLLDDRPFDLMFAPTSAYTRFHSIPRENLIGASSQTDPPCPSENPGEPWYRDWADFVFHPGGLAPEFCEFDEVSQLLESDPTSIQKVFLIRELRRRIPDSPTAVVGLMDVVAALGPAEADARNLKEEVASLALKSMASIPDARDALNCYFLVNERLRRTPFGSVGARLASELSSGVASRTTEQPESAIKTAEPLFISSESIHDSAFIQGVVKGLLSVGAQCPERLDVLQQWPTAASYIISDEPLIAAYYLRGMASAGLMAKAADDLVSWIRSLSLDLDSRRHIREALLPNLAADDAAQLLEELLRGVPATDVPKVLESLSGTEALLKVARIRRVASEQLSVPYPLHVREWASQTTRWSTGAAPVVADTYKQDTAGLNELLAESFHDASRKAEITAAFIEAIAVDRLPSWFKEYLRQSPRMFLPLMALGVKTPQHVLITIHKVLDQVKDIPFAREQSLLQNIGAFVNCPFGDSVVDQAMRSVVGSFIEGYTDFQTCQAWQRTEWGKRWLLSTQGWDLKSLITRPLYNNSDAWERAWTWLAEIPEEVFARAPLIVLELTQGLISPRYPWTASIVPAWVKVLRRAHQEAERSIYLRLCGNALKFAFDHRRAAVSSLIVETFRPIHDCITSSTDIPPEINNQLGLFGWDKGKELRKELVYSFMDSQWRPGDLAVAAKDIFFLRKIFKRVMRRYKGEAYVTAMLQDLQERDDASSRMFLGHLRQLAQNPDFYEEWD